MYRLIRFKSLSFITEVFNFPIVSCEVVCLFKLVISTVSKSTIKFVHLYSNYKLSVVNPPTPPTPKIMTLEFCNFFKLSLPLKVPFFEKSLI